MVKCDAADRPCVLVARPRESMFTSSASQTAELDQDIVAVLTGSQSPSHTRRVGRSAGSRNIWTNSIYKCLLLVENFESEYQIVLFIICNLVIFE